MHGAAKIRFDIVVDKPGAVCRPVRAATAISIHAVRQMVAPCVLERVFGEVISYALDVRIVLVGQLPSCVLDYHFAVRVWTRREKLAVSNEMRKERRVVIWSKQRPELLQIPQKRRRFVVVYQSAEGVKTRLAFFQKPVLFQSLACRRICFPHADAAIWSTCRIGATEELVLDVLATSRRPKSTWYTMCRIWSQVIAPYFPSLHH